MFRKMRKVESSTDSHKSSQIEFVQMCADLWSLSKKKLCVSALKTRKSIRRHLHNLHFYTAKSIRPHFRDIPCIPWLKKKHRNFPVGGSGFSWTHSKVSLYSNEDSPVPPFRFPLWAIAAACGGFGEPALPLGSESRQQSGGHRVTALPLGTNRGAFGERHFNAICPV